MGGIPVKNKFLYKIKDLCEDKCKIFYTRKNGKVLCFNPNDRSSCKGCKFCYKPACSDNQFIPKEMLYSVFTQWLLTSKCSDLSHLEQVAVVTGWFKSEDIVVSYLLQLRDCLLKFGFDKEILYLGLITKKDSLDLLRDVKPINLCFTVECFENRKKLLRVEKSLEMKKIVSLMQYSLRLGFKTNFSYILGLDSIDALEEGMRKMKNYVNTFPIISLYQTNNTREKYRNQEALNTDYYLGSRKYMERIFSMTDYKPNSWSNYRSLWRTCYGKDNTMI